MVGKAKIAEPFITDPYNSKPSFKKREGKKITLPFLMV
jgi:hypothetical protein